MPPTANAGPVIIEARTRAGFTAKAPVNVKRDGQLLLDLK